MFVILDQINLFIIVKLAYYLIVDLRNFVVNLQIELYAYMVDQIYNF